MTMNKKATTNIKYGLSRFSKLLLVIIFSLIIVLLVGIVVYFRVPSIHSRVNFLSYRAKVNSEYLLNIKHKGLVTQKNLVPYETVYKDDPTLEIGQSWEAWSTGKDGERTIVFEVTYRGEKELTRIEVSNGITKESEPHITYEGTKPKPVYYETYVTEYISALPTYQNTYGYTVPRPTYAPIPSTTPTAQCYDYSYSYSLNASGTCSGHGGVMLWY